MTDNVVKFNREPRVSVLPVLDADFEEYMPKCMELIAPAVMRQSNNVTLDDIEDDIRGGGSVMWAVHVEDTLVAAITTCVVRHPQRNTLKIEFMGGTGMKNWVRKALDVLTGLAKKAGLDAIEADGRKGFEKHAGPLAFREIYTHYVMELD